MSKIKMKVMQDFPPNYIQIKKYFNLPPTVVFTYGDIIYAPMFSELPDHLIAHEEVHCLQQGDDPEDWWRKYLVSPAFRLHQEVEAYRAQYQFMVDNHVRSERRRLLNSIIKDLSGPIYGKIVSKDRARELITGSEDIPTP